MIALALGGRARPLQVGDEGRSVEIGDAGRHGRDLLMQKPQGPDVIHLVVRRGKLLAGAGDDSSGFFLGVGKDGHTFAYEPVDLPVQWNVLVGLEELVDVLVGLASVRASQLAKKVFLLFRRRKASTGGVRGVILHFPAATSSATS